MPNRDNSRAMRDNLLGGSLVFASKAGGCTHIHGRKFCTRCGSCGRVKSSILAAPKRLGMKKIWWSTVTLNKLHAGRWWGEKRADELPAWPCWNCPGPCSMDGSSLGSWVWAEGCWAELTKEARALAAHRVSCGLPWAPALTLEKSLCASAPVSYHSCSFKCQMLFDRDCLTPFFLPS